MTRRARRGGLRRRRGYRGAGHAQTCYRLAFDHWPTASAGPAGPSVTVDDGNPRLERYPC